SCERSGPPGGGPPEVRPGNPTPFAWSLPLSAWRSRESSFFARMGVSWAAAAELPAQTVIASADFPSVNGSSALHTGQILGCVELAVERLGQPGVVLLRENGRELGRRVRAAGPDGDPELVLPVGELLVGAPHRDDVGVAVACEERYAAPSDAGDAPGFVCHGE